MTTMSPYEYLASEGVSLRNYSAGQHKTICPRCSHTRKNPKDPCLSVNIKPDGDVVGHCFHCDFKLSMPGFRMTAVSPVVHKAVARKDKPIKVLNAIQTPEIDHSKYSQEFWDFFKNRGISEETILNSGVFESSKKFYDGAVHKCIVFPYIYTVDGQQKTYNHKYRSYSKQFMQESGAHHTLYNIDGLFNYWKHESKNDRKPVIIVEGEMDVIAFMEAGIDYAVSMPNGSQSNKIELDNKLLNALYQHQEVITHATDVIIATDADKPGINLANALTEIFGENRCWKIDWSIYGVKDANELLIKQEKAGLRNTLTRIERITREGHLSPSNYQVKERLKANLKDRIHGRLPEPLSTGFQFLDEIYRVEPGTVNAITGIPSHGKSNFLDQVMLNMANEHNWRFLVFSPETGTEKHFAKLVEKYSGKPYLNRMENHLNDEEVDKGANFIADYFEFLDFGYGNATLEKILDLAVHVSDNYKVNGLVIDPYSMISKGDVFNENAFVEKMLQNVGAFARTKNIAVFIVAHPRKPPPSDNSGKVKITSAYEISGSSHWYNLCDNIFSVNRNFVRNETSVLMLKIKDQDICGLSGKKGESFFLYDVETRRYTNFGTKCEDGTSYGDLNEENADAGEPDYD